MKKLIIVLIFVSSITLFSQEEKYSYGLGIVTTSILGNNPAKAPILQTDTNQAAIIGGSFEMVQTGLQGQFTLNLDEDNNWRLPISLEYSFFSGKQLFYLSSLIIDKYSHSLNSLNLNTGIQRVLYRIPYAKAKVYAGLEARFTYLHNIEFKQVLDYLQLNEFDVTNTYSKENAFRVGGLVRLGIEGRLRNNFYINTGCAYSLTNLIGADDTRGELFTPFKISERTESLVSNMHFYLLIQYHIR